MARKPKKGKTVKEETKQETVATPEFKDKTPVVKEVEEIVKDTKPKTKAAEDIVTKAVSATKVKSKPVPKPIKQDVKEDVIADTKKSATKKDKKEEPVTSMYDLYLGRYCKVVAAYNSKESNKRPIGAFSNLAHYVVRSNKPVVYNEMLKFFTLEGSNIVSNNNALNGIETITDPTLKTRIMTAFTVFNGLASQRRTGRRPTFSINAIRSILRNERFINWVNQVMNG